MPYIVYQVLVVLSLCIFIVVGIWTDLLQLTVQQDYDILK